MNSDHIAACLRRGEAQEALADLRAVLLQHNMCIDVADDGDVIEISIGHDVVKTIDGNQLGEWSLHYEN